MAFFKMVIMLKPTSLHIVIAFAVAGILYIVANFFYASDTRAENINKETYRVGYADIEQFVTTTGILKPKVQVNVGAQVNGRLNKLLVKEGDIVSRGQLLAEIDPTLPQNDVDSARAELANAMAQKKITLLSLKQSISDYQRQKKMARDDATTVSELENAKTEYESNKEQLHINEIQISQANVKLKIAQANLNYTRITSPIAGVVLGILTQEGQTIVSSQAAPTIMVVANLDTMNVNIRISEMDILKTKINMPLWFTVTASPDTRYSSTLTSIQQIPEEMLYESKNNQSDISGLKKTATYYNGSFEIKNEKHRLKPAMSAQVHLIVDRKENVKVIPVRFLGAMNRENHYLVKVMTSPDSSALREIQTGIKNDKFIEVVKGLEIGDTIIKDTE